MVQDESKATDRQGCAQVVLARGVVAQVGYCVACATFHVDIESVSIRFRATALRDLRDTLSAALAAYDRALTQLADESVSAPAQREGLH
jgi:hypothetical protein